MSGDGNVIAVSEDYTGGVFVYSRSVSECDCSPPLSDQPNVAAFHTCLVMGLTHVWKLQLESLRPSMPWEHQVQN